MTTSANRLSEILREKVETLFGDRGNSDNHAVRQKDLAGLNNALGGLVSKTGSLGDSIKGAQSGIADTVSNLTALGNLVNTIHADLGVLQGRVTTDEGNVTTLQTGVSDLQSKLSAAHGVAVASGTSAPAAGSTPTKAEHDALVADVAAIRAALAALVAAL